ncbi:Fungalysin metallopeptidase-domain-containing protein [Kickxella alabastrina]|uniref:Fungalysin metallopeptidase-domain-containing protein n=1 Tax=Kickxella alabastrina TaxID=61397 RepID=UPI00221E8653|nr:Fungalysin metallopeptidase-domain-containing protein [Kickxella alabastrina]KAI7822760.1 Fungalysin metallopeptidase-domain-containing protein [Kickxella alabastrina]
MQVSIPSLIFAATLAATIAHGHVSSATKPIQPQLKNNDGLIIHPEPIPLLTITPNSATDSVESLGNAAVRFISQTVGIPQDNVRVSHQFIDTFTGITHVHLVQTLDSMDISNSVANVNIKGNKVISSSHTFAPQTSLHEAAQFVKTSGDSAKEALGALAKHLDIPLSSSDLDQVTVSTVNRLLGSQQISIEGIPTKLALDGTAMAERAYVQNESEQLVPVWRIIVEQQDHWWNSYVDGSGKVVRLADWYSQSESYLVYPRNVLSPDDGQRRLLSNPASHVASPRGWSTGKSTIGNNVWAQSNPDGGSSWRLNHRPKSVSGKFSYPLGLTKEPATYVDASITQLFYTNNLMHDLSFIYGFTEEAGNFQDINYSGKGLASDSVIANTQDGSGTDNANFATPPDGQHPRMRMYIWTQTTPSRDSSLEQDIVAHEYTHGISNRLTGGAANSDCLSANESGGMGEGWSDAVANLLRLNTSYTAATDLTLGDYVYTKNIRKYPYSTSITTNPSTYQFLDRPDYKEVHSIGEVWAEMLYEATWALITKNGMAEDLFARDLTKGNSIMLQILLDGMKLQPCNPSFVDARNAILQAESNLSGGSNRCVLWKAFAKRGLGVNATGKDGTTHTEDFSVPAECLKV